MRFASPAWLNGIYLVPLAYLLVRYLIHSKMKNLGRFAHPSMWNKIIPELDWSKPKRKEKIFWMSFALILLAAARPQWGRIEETVKTTGLDLVLIVDISRSMEVEDVVPNRLKKTKHMIRSLLERIRGDRVGLVAFAGSAYLAVPLTTDLGYLDEQISLLSPDWIQNQGSDLGIALEAAKGALDRAAEEGSKKLDSFASKAVILFSDGEDHEDAAIDVAKKFSEAGSKLYVFSVGTETGGPIPVRDETGQLRGYKRTKKGDVVMSKANPGYMQKLAAAGNGKYWAASNTEVEIDEMLQDMGGLNRTEMLERKIVSYQEQFQWPLLFAVILLLVEWMLPNKSLGKSPLKHLIKKDYDLMNAKKGT